MATGSPVCQGLPSYIVRPMILFCVACVEISRATTNESMLWSFFRQLCFWSAVKCGGFSCLSNNSWVVILARNWFIHGSRPCDPRAKLSSKRYTWSLDFPNCELYFQVRVLVLWSWTGLRLGHVSLNFFSLAFRSTISIKAYPLDIKLRQVTVLSVRRFK